MFMQYLAVAWVITGLTLLSFLLQRAVGYQAIALIYLLGVVVLGVFVGRGPTLLAATLSALLWDFFFLKPVHTLRISHFEDVMLFGMYFVVALVLGQLTARIRAQERAERQGQERATALYLLTREVAEAGSVDQMLEKVIGRMGLMLDAQVAVLLPDAVNSLRLRRQPHPASTLAVSDADFAAAEWVFANGRAAGRFTDERPRSDALYEPLSSGGGAVGVIGLRFDQQPPPASHQWQLIEAASQQIATALDQHRLREVSEQTQLLAESERLGKTLLNSISHEIRTPIAAITSAVGELLENPETGLHGSQRGMLGEIQEATDRLNRLVGNVLEITRLESGRLKPRAEWCDVSDLVHVGVKETQKQLSRHTVVVEVAAGLPLARMDYVLMEQALTNLLSNAAHHTPPGTPVEVSARVADGVLLLAVADRGPGFPEGAIPRLFDKFYRGPAAPTGGTGLGLSLVKGFVEAQGGRVTAENRAGGGAVFTISLPLGQAPAIPAPAKV
jgi:two-component system sensor histidine kinase KdpD